MNESINHFNQSINQSIVIIILIPVEIGVFRGKRTQQKCQMKKPSKNEFWQYSVITDYDNSSNTKIIIDRNRSILRKFDSQQKFQKIRRR